jgi:hypothetical protein
VVVDIMVEEVVLVDLELELDFLSILDPIQLLLVLEHLKLQILVIQQESQEIPQYSHL